MVACHEIEMLRKAKTDKKRVPVGNVIGYYQKRAMGTAYFEFVVKATGEIRLHYDCKYSPNKSMASIVFNCAHLNPMFYCKSQ